MQYGDPESAYGGDMRGNPSGYKDGTDLLSGLLFGVLFVTHSDGVTMNTIRSYMIRVRWSMVFRRFSP